MTILAKRTNRLHGLSPQLKNTWLAPLRMPPFFVLKAIIFGTKRSLQALLGYIQLAYKSESGISKKVYPETGANTHRSQTRPRAIMRSRPRGRKCTANRHQTKLSHKNRCPTKPAP